MKICKQCRQEKALTEFYTHKSTKDGLRGKCKPCFLKDTSRWQKFNPLRCKLKVYRYRAKLSAKP